MKEMNAYKYSKTLHGNRMVLTGSLLVFVVFCFSCSTHYDQSLYEKFQNPDLHLRMNRNLHNFPYDNEQQDSLIESTLANGWGGFALNTPLDEYLSEKGLEATLSLCKKAKEKGMDLWLYDELGYPSGNAGDRVINENPD